MYIEHSSLCNMNHNGICDSVDYLLSLAKRSPGVRQFRGYRYRLPGSYSLLQRLSRYTNSHAQAVRAIIASIRNSFVSQLRTGLVKTLVHNLIGKLIIL